MSEVSEAIDAMAERKSAATGRERESTATAIPLDVHRSIMTGLDLDYEELYGSMDALFDTFSETLKSALLMEGVDRTNQTQVMRIIMGVTAGFWVDGLMTGVLLQQRREQGD